MVDATRVTVAEGFVPRAGARDKGRVGPRDLRSATNPLGPPGCVARRTPDTHIAAHQIARRGFVTGCRSGARRDTSTSLPRFLAPGTRGGCASRRSSSPGPGEPAGRALRGINHLSSAGLRSLTLLVDAGCISQQPIPAMRRTGLADEPATTGARRAPRPRRRRKRCSRVPRIRQRGATGFDD
jgi:hypothetical protein